MFPVCLCLDRKELSAIAIHHGLVATHGRYAVSYSSVTRYLRDVIFVSPNSLASIPEAELQSNDCDQAILLALAEQQFASIRELTRLTYHESRCIGTRPSR
jgi:hypothetical protein